MLQNVTGVDLPLRKLGYSSVITMLGEFENIHIERTSSNDWTIYNARIYRANKPSKRVDVLYCSIYCRVPPLRGLQSLIQMP